MTDCAPILEAYRIAATANRDVIAAAARRAPAGSAAAKLLCAVQAQYEGDVDSAIAQLRRVVASCGPQERAAVADTLAPMLVMRGRIAEVAELAELLEAGGWALSATTFRAMACAHDADRAEARRLADFAAMLLEDEHDGVIRMRVLQRLARIAFLLHDHARATELALASARTAERMGAYRTAAAGYWTAYSIHGDVTGDRDEALRYVTAWREAAERSGDDSFVYSALVAEFELAVHAADSAGIAMLRRQLRDRRMPEQYLEYFPLSFSDALAHGAHDLAAMRTLLQLIRDVPGRSRGEWSLCTALIAVAHAVAGDVDAARSQSRRAIHKLGRVRSGDAAFERRYRRLARVSAAVACDLIGDRVRADRTMASRELDGDAQGEAMLRVLAERGDLDSVTKWNRGFGAVFANAYARQRTATRPSGLTAAEFEVLKLLGEGWTALRIATETRRSVNTVYNHTRSILAKFNASRSAEAVALARKSGFLN